MDGWSLPATAERFGVDPKTVRKWRDPFVAEGPGGLVDRPSRPTGRRGAARRRCALRWSACVAVAAGETPRRGGPQAPKPATATVHRPRRPQPLGLHRAPRRRTRRNSRRVVVARQRLVRRILHHVRAGHHRQWRLLPQPRMAQSLHMHSHEGQGTRSCRPQSNGKVERFHRTLIEEWAYIRRRAANNNAKTPTADSSTTTITTEPTARSAGKHPPGTIGNNLPAMRT